MPNRQEAAWTIIEEIADILDVDHYEVTDRTQFPKPIALAVAGMADVVHERHGNGNDILRSALRDEGYNTVNRDLLELAEFAYDFVTHPVVSPMVARERTQHTPATLNQRVDGKLGASSKLEAVNLLSRLTESGPETITPAGRGRSQVLNNLWDGLFDDHPPVADNVAVTKEMVERLDGTFEDSDHTRGFTITLSGLNKVLRLAQDKLSPGPISVKAEADMYIGATLQALDQVSANDLFRHRAISGQKAIEQMFTARYRMRKNPDWFPWYVEFKTLPTLRETFGGGSHKHAGSWFDYHGARTWEIKASAGEEPLVLNTKDGIEAAVADGGLGIIVVEYIAYDDDPEFFDSWRRAKIGAPSGDPRTEPANITSVAEPERVSAFFIDDADHLRRLVDEGVLSVATSGRQLSRAPKVPKYVMDLAKAKESSMFVTSID